MKPLLWAAVAALLCFVCPFAVPIAEAQEKPLTIVLDGRTFTARTHPLPLQHGEENYRSYFERLWESDPDLRRCLNAIAPSLGDGISALLATMETPPEDAQIRVDKKGLTIVPDRVGSGYDRRLLGLAVVDCLDGLPPTSLVRAPVVAEITREQLQKRTQKIGEYATRYDAGNTARSRNLALACDAITGQVVASGEIWSFNQTVGARTAQRGYLPAPVIVDGNYTSGIGGGVCQVSTTLYNAVLRAGLDVIESRPHTLRSHYVPAGLDAMVSDWSDLTFVNATPYPVYLFAQAKGGVLSIKVLGASVGKVKLWTGAPVVTAAPDVDQAGNLLDDTAGYSLVKRGEDGIKVTTYRSIDGVKRQLRTSTYPPVPNVWSKDAQ